MSFLFSFLKPNSAMPPVSAMSPDESDDEIEDSRPSRSKSDLQHSFIRNGTDKVKELESKVKWLSLKVDDYKTRYKEACQKMEVLENQSEVVEVIVEESDHYDSDQELDANISRQTMDNVMVASSVKLKDPPGEGKWIHGTILLNPHYARPLNQLPPNYIDKDVFILEESMEGHKFLPPLKKDDRVKLQLFTKPGKKDTNSDGRLSPKAFKSKMDVFVAKRSLRELSEYFKMITENAIDRGTRSETMNAIMNCTPLWEYLLAAKTEPPKHYESYIRVLYTFLMNVSNFMSSHLTQKSAIVTRLMSRNLVGEIGDLRERNKAHIWQIEAMIDCDRSRIKDCIKSLGDIVKNNSTEEARFLHRLLLKIAGLVDLEKWQELTPIPSIQEMFGDPLEKVSFLKSIVLGKPYDSVDQYLNINYRLLRAECFSSIQKGIADLTQDLKRDKLDHGRCLDPRDMSVYFNVTLVDCVNDRSRSTFYLSFRPDQPVNDWNKSRKLMFGNLLCATATGDFSDAIWFTVIDRDWEKLSRGPVIGVELVTFEGDQDAVDSALTLLTNSGRIVMAESPTYFMSFRHLLDSLRSSTLESFTLCKEIVYGNAEKQLTLSVSDEILEECGYETLEESQKEAFDHALVSPLAIIQGPPGTGKTFVGAKLAELFFLLNTHNETVTPENQPRNTVLREPPILVLTYKNHALDEFLKHCLNFCPKEYMVRMGGQSKEPELADCVMRIKLRESDFKKKPIHYLIKEVGELFNEFKDLLDEFSERSAFNVVVFCKQITANQLDSFITCAFANSPGRLYTYKEWSKDPQFLESFTARLESFTSEAQCKPLRDNEQDMFCADFIEKFNKWLPSKDHLKELSGLIARGNEFFLPPEEQEDPEEDEEDTSAGPSENPYVDQDLDKVDEVDEDYVNEQLMQRTSAFDEEGMMRAARQTMTEHLTNLAKQKASSKPFEYTASDFPRSCTPKRALLKVSKLYNMAEIDRYSYIYTALVTGVTEVVGHMKRVLEQFTIRQTEKVNVDNENKLRLLRQQRIVGATIVGASIQLSLLQKLNPKIVIIEECAEIMEPCLVGILTKSVERLILIGDHQQLRPQVDTYYLKRQYNLHISMMERLIRLDFPFKTLRRQGRMRPEFSNLLLDIYPEYKDFPDLETKNPPVGCISKSMFWWTHNYPEVKQRTVRNEAEAGMVVSLALYLIKSNVPPEEITIICGYLGQVQTVKSYFRTEYPTEPEEPTVQIRSIDEYQGDENNYVIISLTRSNGENNIGFMKEMERRCVAQSRAKCGLYFVGNVNCFRPNATWIPVITKLASQNLISDRLPICCYLHRDKTIEVAPGPEVRANISDESRITYYVKNAESWCKVPCKELYSCEIEEHRCQKLCTPRHDHLKCTAKVEHTFVACGHTSTVFCHQDEKTMECKIKVKKELTKCGHEMEVSCHRWSTAPNSIICDRTCKEVYQCADSHPCTRLCGEPHTHNYNDCTARVPFNIPRCGHLAAIKKICGKAPPRNVQCKFQLNYKSDYCGHQQSRVCHEAEKCVHACTAKRPDCKHPCKGVCFESCLLRECELCLIEHKKVVVLQKLAAKKQYENAKKEAEKEGDSVTFVEVPVTDRSRRDLEDKCHSFFHHGSKFTVSNIKEIYRVRCPKNSAEFWDAAATKANGFLQEELFKVLQTSLDPGDIVDLASLINPLADFGAGIFIDFSKNAIDGDILEQTDLTVIIGDLLVGDMIPASDIEVPGGADGPTRKVLNFLKHKKRDSILMSRLGEPAKYRVFDRCLIHVKYLVKLELAPKVISPPDSILLESYREGETRFRLADLDLRNVNDPKVELIGKAIAAYNGDNSKRPVTKRNDREVKHVGIVHNKRSEAQYRHRQEQVKEPYEIFAYHATAKENIGSILETNLDPHRSVVHGRAYGDGCYFSEYPEFSLKYGQECMLVFRLLLIEGKYKKVQPDEAGFCEQLVLNDANLFKPVFVLWFVDDPPACTNF